MWKFPTVSTTSIQTTLDESVTIAATAQGVVLSVLYDPEGHAQSRLTMGLGTVDNLISRLKKARDAAALMMQTEDQPDPAEGAIKRRDPA